MPANSNLLSTIRIFGAGIAFNNTAEKIRITEATHSTQSNSIQHNVDKNDGMMYILSIWPHSSQLYWCQYWWDYFLGSAFKRLIACFYCTNYNSNWNCTNVWEFYYSHFLYYYGMNILLHISSTSLYWALNFTTFLYFFFN